MLASLGARTVTPVVMRNAGSSPMQSAVTEIHPVVGTATTPRTTGRCAVRRNPMPAKMKPTALVNQLSALHHRRNEMIAHVWTRASAEQGNACHTARQEGKSPACATQRWTLASVAVDLHTMLPASRRSRWKF